MLYAQHKTTKKRTTPATNLPPINDQWGRLREKCAVTYSVGKITNLFIYLIIPCGVQKYKPVFAVFPLCVQSVCKSPSFIWRKSKGFKGGSIHCESKKKPATTEIAGFLLWNIATL